MLSQLSYTPTYIGAGEGDRTLTAGLEGQNSTIELHPPRTCDPLLVRQMLSQLSYTPTYIGAGEGDRTLTAGLEGQNSTIELHPRIKKMTPRGIEPLLPP